MLLAHPSVGGWEMADAWTSLLPHAHALASRVSSQHGELKLVGLLTWCPASLRSRVSKVLSKALEVL